MNNCSLTSRVGVGNDSELNVRDEVREDDEEFFQGNSYEEDGGGSGEGRGEGDKENRSQSVSQAATLGGQQPQHSGHFPSFPMPGRPYASNLSKITEAPEEFSFAFKQGENAVNMLNRDHEELRQQNMLRLPSMSFHASRYSMKHSWEESALKHQQNATLAMSFARSELDLSMNQAPVKSSQPTPPCPFLSGTRSCLYFGFCRLGFESYQNLLLRNIHPDHQRVQIRCVWRHKNEAKCFKLVRPSESVEAVLGWNQLVKVVVGFTPPDAAYYKNFLKIECRSGDQTREYIFMVHGHGGRAVVEPIMQDRSGSMRFSANGQYQLLVRSAAKFRFALHNRGQRGAFASLLFYHPNGTEIPAHDLIVNMHNLLLSKEGMPDPATKTIEVRYLGARSSSSASSSSSQSVASGSPDTSREITMKIAVIWGEEKQRQRLKQFERKEMDNLCEELKNFGHNFTSKRHFNGEPAQLEEQPHISEEEYYCFDRQTRVTHINVIERTQPPMVPPATAIPQQRSGSALSVVSEGTGGRRELRAHQTIVEMDADNTLTGGVRMDEAEDETLT